MTVAVCYPEKYPVEETFQLLRIPWEWYIEGNRYDVVIARKADVAGYDGPVIDLTDNDFFRKIADLLNRGEMHLHEPSCDIELDRVRQEIKRYIVLVEIPPVPWGHPYMVALTHDVDVTSVKECRFTTVGYAAYQCCIQGNGAAGLRLLAARCGFGKDPWILFDRWKELEGSMGVRSTFFFVPRPDEPGQCAHPYRSVCYHADPGVIASLPTEGWEAGVHGIDNWIDARLGAEEREVLGGTSGGNRTHWLLFGEKSWQVLEAAGYSWDSTFGYNDDAGFRAGTLQVYRPEHVDNLLELPLHIQDLGLFGEFCWALARDEWEKTPCLHLSAPAARDHCDHIFGYARKYGGAVTLLWHYENLVPPRDWSGLYRDLITRAKSDGAWVTTAGNVVEWFRKRRQIHITCVPGKNKLTISVEGNLSSDLSPPLMMRIHIPGNRMISVNADYLPSGEYIDVKLDKMCITVSFV
ncbi:hypothetical protein [Methanoregula sp.]|uniref:hypothetical protein n=1 Tax=Methanoregula sp. TaxID=2052170 RepID=UPI002369A426|nr:hypothetical protein [Methanoregula sp.]MDD1687180.1 hypothetical protein [Methanoregula sp.]